MPYQVTLVPNYLVSEWLNILDTKWAIWLPGIFSPFAVFLLTKYMRRIPYGILEAAKVDGAGEFQIFRYICVPLCKGALASVAILVFIDYKIRFFTREKQKITLCAAKKYFLGGNKA